MQVIYLTLKFVDRLDVNMSKLIAQAVQFGGGFKPPTDAYSETGQTTEGTLSNLELFISNIIGVLTLLAGIFFIIYFILGAFKWVTAGGDSGKVGKARDEMVQGVLGLIIIVMAYGIIGIVGSILGLDILNPAAVLETLVPTP